MKTLLFVVTSLAAVACQTSQPAEGKTPSVSTAAATVSPDGPSPVEVTVRAIAESATGATLEVSVRKAIATERPLGLSMRLPAGVEASPATLRQVDATATGLETRLVQLSFKERPSTDLIVVADLQGKAMGYHAEVPYRFGRPEPVAPALPRSGPVQVGPHALGHPVDLGAPAAGQ